MRMPMFLDEEVAYETRLLCFSMTDWVAAPPARILAEKFIVLAPELLVLRNDGDLEFTCFVTLRELAIVCWTFSRWLVADDGTERSEGRLRYGICFADG